MKISRFLVGLFIASILGVSANGGEPKVRIISELDGFEPFEAHLFHASHLWVGRSRKDLAAFYRLEIFDRHGKMVVSKELQHSLRYIHPYESNSVIIVGIGLDQLSHYTIATLNGSNVSLVHRTIPVTALADRWAGSPGRFYFTDPGGYDDPAHPTPPDQPLQTLFKMDSFGPRYLKPRLAGPRESLMMGNSLYVISGPSIGTGKFLNVIDIQTESLRTLISDGKGLSHMRLLPSGKLALLEVDAARVREVDLKTKEVHSLVTTDARPSDFAIMGSCLAIGLEEQRRVQFFELSAVSVQKVAEWDLSVAGSGFMALRNLAADSITGNIYARSAYPCQPFTECLPRNSVVIAEGAGTDIKARCHLSY
ncbi:MAG: hypothetical protein HY537_06780 [Deltaproteobacteria bacterium]|nr:hypothetical protein [Deltaproteobacteria bacterium]